MFSENNELDEDQAHAFEGVMAAFVLRIFEEVQKDDPHAIGVTGRMKRKLDSVKNDLEKVLREEHLICFLSGAGGTGKSHVLKAIVKYSKSLCENLKMEYTRRTIVVTALTGAAAVAILGETTHKAACLKKRVDANDVNAWKKTHMIIVDEVSFAKREDLEKLNDKLKELKEQNKNFGGIIVVFAGDFSQLKPVGSKPLYEEKDFVLWTESVHTFYELRTNHRFKKDPKWGSTLADYREHGPTQAQVDYINTRVIGSPGGPKESDIPVGIAYATANNLDRCAINDGIFAQHLKETHSRDPDVVPPTHTVCIKASNLQWVKTRGRNKEYVNFNKRMADFFHATVCEAQCKANTKSYDPMLKLYHGCPVMINKNLDVENCVANGTMCKFAAIVLKPDVNYADLERICIDGYYVWCANETQIESIKLQLLDGLTHKDEVRFVHLTSETHAVRAHVPITLTGEVAKATYREYRNCRFKTFPINISHARTIHKLQGRSLEAILISTWDYTGNWIYVALSRVCTLKGLYLRFPLKEKKCKPMPYDVRHFMDALREKGAPPRVELAEEARKRRRFLED